MASVDATPKSVTVGLCRESQGLWSLPLVRAVSHTSYLEDGLDGIHGDESNVKGDEVAAICTRW